MPASAEIVRVPLEQIIVPAQRQRKDIKNLGELEDSIRRVGLLNPIIVKRDFTLVAGERRLRAWQELRASEEIIGGTLYETIPVHFLDEMDEHELRIVELDENIKRQDITWQEQMQAVSEIHRLLAKDDPQWNAAATAERLGLSTASISRYLTIARESAESEKILAAPTVSSAMGMIKRSEERKEQESKNALSDLLRGVELEIEDLGQPRSPDEPELDLEETAPQSTPALGSAPIPAKDSILCEDAIKFMATYSGPRFNIIHCDFPYGIDFDSGWDHSAEQWEGYEDSPEIYWELLKALGNFWDNIAAPSAHLVFWFSMKFHEETRKFFAEHIPQVTLDPFPLVWVKSDNRGSLPDPNRGPRRVYETALFGSAGDRKIVRAVGNAYAAPSQRASSIHISEKPEPVLKHFLGMLVDETSTLFDPTCGSGSALRAAEALGARRVLGLEKNEGFANAARKALDGARVLRSTTGRS